MKITALNLYKVLPRWVFLEIETDEGIVGWGEPVVEGRSETLVAAVCELKSILLGSDPTKINDLWQQMYVSGFYRGGPVLMSAIAGVDQALWDILGKSLNKPVIDLLGGAVRERMKAYCWVGGDDPSHEIEQIEAATAHNRDTFKLNGCGRLKLIDSRRAVDSVVNRVMQIREHFGDRIDFALDFHGRVSLPMARLLLRELEDAKPLFVEEPVLPEHAHAFQELADRTAITLAAGERMYTRHDFRPVLESGGLGIVQPDLSHAGGITECVKIATMADTYNVGFAPHCPLGPIALASCLAVDFVSPNAVLQEHAVGLHYNEGVEPTTYIKNKQVFDLTDGYVNQPELPGLGIKIDREAVIEASRVAADWKSPIWRHSDGSISEW